MTQARMIRLHKVPDTPRLLDPSGKGGLREMEERDVQAVADLFSRYMRRFDMSFVMTRDEVRHQFLSGRGQGPPSKDSWKMARERQVVWTYVYEVRMSDLVSQLLDRFGWLRTFCRTHRRTRSRTSYRSTVFRQRS